MKVTYGCTIPQPKRRTMAEEYEYVKGFNEDAKHKTMCFVYDDEKQARNKMNSLRNMIKKEGFKIKTVCREASVYLEKE